MTFSIYGDAPDINQESEAMGLDDFQSHHAGDVDHSHASKDERIWVQEELEVQGYMEVGNAEAAGMYQYTPDEMNAMFFDHDYDWALALEEDDTQRGGIDEEEQELEQPSPETHTNSPQLSNHQQPSGLNVQPHLPCPLATSNNPVFRFQPNKNYRDF